jgi:glutathione synthase/RimK-type ligase-like ATP-grasp enzyme
MFIFRRKGGISAQALAKLIGCRCSKKEIPKGEFVINYGQKYEQANLNANVNFNKVQVQKILENEGIRVPKMFNKEMSISKKEYPLLARKNYHSKGRDILFVKTESDLRKIDGSQYDYLVKYIDKNKEYRVHILGKYKAIVNVKITKKEDKANEIVRSHDNGWIQVEYTGEFKQKLIEIAKNVLNVLKYDFGAIDIILGKDGYFYVLEINSAPGLEDRKLQIYADYFKYEEEKFRGKKQVKNQGTIKNKEYINNQGEYAWKG